MSGLPEGWGLAELGQLGTWRGGGTPSKANPAYWKGQIPWVSPKDMKVRLISDAEDHISEAAVSDSATQLIPAESILIVTRSGILSHTLPVGLNTIPVTINQDLKAITGFKGINPQFLFRALESFGGAILNTCSKTGTTVASVEFDRLKQFQIPLAPLAEQEVIADKLDALLAQVDTLRSRLDSIPAILKRFRQSVLSAAVTGKLTEEWRGNEEENWTKGILSNFCNKISDGEHQTPLRSESGRFLLSARNVLNGSLSLTNVDFVNESEFIRIRKRCDPDIGDVLLSCSGTVGRVCLVDRSGEYVMVRSVAFIRPMRTIIPKFMMFCLQSPELQKQIREKSKATAQSNIFLGSIGSLEISVPSLPEQTEIVRRVESLFAFADQIEARVQEATSRVKHLTQSILAKAFRGDLTEEWRKAHPELVTGENSAAALLERIRAARVAAPDAKGKRGRKK